MGFWDNTDESDNEEIVENEMPLGIEKSGPYLLQPEMVYLETADSNAISFTIEAEIFDTETGEVIGKQTFKNWIVSGDEKGNKVTYTAKNGKEVTLPSWVQVKSFIAIQGASDKDLSSIGAIKAWLMQNVKKDVTIEQFGNKITVDAIDKKWEPCIATIQLEENPGYSEKANVLHYFPRFELTSDLDDELAERFEKDMKLIKKQPIKKAKVKKAKKVSKEDKEAASGW